jgi:hypothetical protein
MAEHIEFSNLNCLQHGPGNLHKLLNLQHSTFKKK